MSVFHMSAKNLPRGARGEAVMKIMPQRIALNPRLPALPGSG